MQPYKSRSFICSPLHPTSHLCLEVVQSSIHQLALIRSQIMRGGDAITGLTQRVSLTYCTLMQFNLTPFHPISFHAASRYVTPLHSPPEWPGVPHPALHDAPHCWSHCDRLHIPTASSPTLSRLRAPLQTAPSFHISISSWDQRRVGGGRERRRRCLAEPCVCVCEW